MTIEEAIRTAIEFETRVAGVYYEALKRVKDERGRRVLELLAHEEQGHVEFLNRKLQEWKDTGKVTAETLKTFLPSRQAVRAKAKALKSTMQAGPKVERGEEEELLQRALEVEVEVGNFYRQLVNELPPEGQALFAPFLEIEEGHQALVQSQIDALTGLGFWFDMQEFQLEAE